MNNKFFLYARKSTDVEDKQVLSIEAQITELRAFAKQNNLAIVEELIEKQSAKIPGRPIFCEMLKRIDVDRKKARIIRQAFELYAKGNSRLEDISNFLAQRGIFSRGGKRIHKTRATFILSNPFYTGLFKYSGELHEGKYEPIITKKLFDTAQEILRQRGKPRHKQKNEPQAFCGLIE